MSLAYGCLDRITSDASSPVFSSTSSVMSSHPPSLSQECRIAFLILPLHTREVNNFALSVGFVLPLLHFINASAHRMSLEVSIRCLLFSHSMSLCLMCFLTFAEPLASGEI